MNGAQWTIYVALPDAASGWDTAAGVTVARLMLAAHDAAGTVTPAFGYTPQDGNERTLVVTIIGDDDTGDNEKKVQYIKQDLVREFNQREALVVKTPVTSVTVEADPDHYCDDDYNEEW